MKAIKVFEDGSIERNKLNKFSQLYSELSGITTQVRDIYFDFGQNWRWTTVLKENKSFGWVQLLTPRQQEMVLSGQFNEVLSELR